MRRRDALVIGGAIAVAVAIPPILRRTADPFEFQPLPGFDGFRRLSDGNFSGGIDPFFGIGTQEASSPLPDVSPCTALFGPEGWVPGEVPVAIFTDFNCPYCKVLEKKLIDLRNAGTPIRLVWHDMPLLGPSSVRYARAVVAARAFGAEDAARDYLSRRVLKPGPQALRDLAQELHVPAEALIQRAFSSAVSATLNTTISLGRRLGIPGTPGTVIGRTLVVGDINEANLKKLIEIEASEPQSLCA